MKIRMFDSLGEDGARQLTGCKIIDESGEPIGTVEGLWMDSSTRRVEYIGVKSTWLSGTVHVVPARDAEIIENDNLIKIRYPVGLIKGAPTFSPGAELAQVDKEEINRRHGRSSASKRSNSIDEIRPEQAANPTSLRGDYNKLDSEQAAQDRNDLKRKEQAFFNQNGFVTDALPEVDVSEELLRTQKEAKARNQEDRLKNGSLD